MSDIYRKTGASPGDGDSKSKSEQVFREFLTRRESGETVSPHEYLTKYPELNNDLEKLFDSLIDTPVLKTSLFGSRPSGRSVFTMPMVRSGQVIGDFRLLNLIGQGGMGQVWEANQISENRKVALKINKHGRASTRSLELFAREARAGGRLDHPGIVTMYDHGEADGIHWIAMELVEGNWTLRNVLDEMIKLSELPADYYRNVALLLADLVSALQAAHEGGVIHRDLKPQNILITHDDKPKITDFGLARITDESAISRTGDFVGTYHYMSPEQVTAGRIDIDHRTDIFSLGVVFYEMLALRRPFEGDTTHQVYEQIVTQDPPNLLEIRSRVPRELVIICGKALEKRRSHRYQSMEELAADLNHFLNSEPIKAKAPGMMRRTTKWVRQHPILSATSAVVAAALLVISFLFVYARIGWSRAEMEKDRALGAEKKAEYRAQEIQNNYDEIMRLSDVKRLSDLEADADALWPAYPENISGFEEWLTRADELLGRLDDHRQTLSSLHENALFYGDSELQKDRETHPQWEALQELKTSRPELEEQIASLESTVSERRTWDFEDMETRWQHDMVSDLVSGLEALSSVEGGLVRDVTERLEFASNIEERSIGAFQDLWEDAIASIADSEECPQYHGLVIEPKVGFVPIGRDPGSGLWEFAHLQTGEIPVRDMDGKLEPAAGMGLVFVLIPGGSFVMGAVKPSGDHPEGSPNVDPEAELDEGPVHEVALQPFFLSKYEMTQGQWLRFKRENPSHYRPTTREGVNLLHPVENVSWKDCADVLFKLNLRLPSESEWEYACRAGTHTVFWTGDDEASIEGAVNLADRYCRDHGGPPDWPYEEWMDDGHAVHAPVGSFRQNGFGLHDVLGNVWEWCQDIYGSYADAPVGGTARAEGSSYRVFRGCSWDYFAYYCRSADRNKFDQGYQDYNLGLRPAASCP